MTSEPSPPRPPDAGKPRPQTLQSQPLTPEDEYYQERGRQEPVERLARLEEVAKFLIAATATTSGLFLAAYKLATGREAPPGGAWELLLPFVLWSLSILALLLVLLPLRYQTGRNEPDSWKRAYVQAGQRKYGWLWAGAGLFIAGLLCGAALLLGT